MTVPLSRRGFLAKGLAALGGLGATAAALSPLAGLKRGDADLFASLTQGHYKEMSAEEKERVLARIRREMEEQTGGTAKVGDAPPLPGVEFSYGLDLSRCIGCRRCVHACVVENNLSRAPEIQYIRVVELPRGTMHSEGGDHHYGKKAVPDAGHYYMPIQCHQCKNPPCVKVCPVKATWQEPDGVTVVDYDWCIGCRYCMAACPYWARRFNYGEPTVPKVGFNREVDYLSNRPRPKGVVEKCTFCLHRTRRGRMPACVEICPAGARKFGNLLDPESEVVHILRSKRIFVLKETAGTLPRFFYSFDERYPRPAGEIRAAGVSPRGVTVRKKSSFPRVGGRGG
ncbi:MAG: 4Fe-4S dicluster domain-containing protein [Planctomycetota bacterium]